MEIEKPSEEWWYERHEERWLLQNAHKIIRDGRIGELARFFLGMESPLERDLVAIASAYNGAIPHASERELVCQSELLHGTDLGFADGETQPCFDGQAVPGKPGDLWLKWRIAGWYHGLKDKYSHVPVTFGQGEGWMLREFPTPLGGFSSSEVDGAMF